MNTGYNSQPSTRFFAVDHQTGALLDQLDAAGMLPINKLKSVRVPMLLPKDQGYHVLELFSEWSHLISSGVKDPEVLVQFAQLRASWRVDDECYDRFLQSQIKLPEREDETEADPIEEGEYPWTEDEIEAWLAVRKQEGLKIDPKTAEVLCEVGFFLNPYGVYRDLGEAEQFTGELYFARRPGGKIRVFFRDLPEATRGKLWQKIECELTDDDDAEADRSSVRH
jgi:hypothetical protein